MTIGSSWLSNPTPTRSRSDGGDVQSGGTVNLTGSPFTPSTTTVGAAGRNPPRTVSERRHHGAQSTRVRSGPRRRYHRAVESCSPQRRDARSPSDDHNWVQCRIRALNTVAGGPSGSEDQSLARYWRVLRERVWVIVACTVLVFLAAVVYVKVAPRTYQAQAEMEVQAAGAGDAVLSALPVLHQTGDPTEDVLTGASLVTTQPVAKAVVQSLSSRCRRPTRLPTFRRTRSGRPA